MSFDPVHDSVVRNQKDNNVVDSTPSKPTLPDNDKPSITPSISRPTAISSLLSPSISSSNAPQQSQHHSSSTPKKTDISNLLSDDNPPPSTHNVLSLKNMINQDDTVTDINDSTVNNTTIEDSYLNNTTTNNNTINKSTPNSKSKKKEKNSILEALNSLQQNKKDEKDKHYLSLLINSRSRHLKKSDGEPYWRKEIQFDFLINLFLNRKRVFKNPYLHDPNYKLPDYFKINIDEHGNEHELNEEYINFFELYVLTLITSNKLSKILKDRLYMDANYTLNFSIACLLVNIGRLNTTVNFDYEMRSQFRTYHSIPSLQVGDQLDRVKLFYKIKDSEEIKQEPSSTNEGTKSTSSSKKSSSSSSSSGNGNGGSGYTASTVKQLQDTPRLKSILKSINDSDENQPKTFKEFIRGIQNQTFHLNIVSLIFIVIMYEFELGKLLFADPESSFYLENNNNTMDHLESEIDDNLDSKTPKSSGSLFNDIWLRILIHPEAKVERFLWLVYFIQETNLNPEKILKNPFNNPEASLTVSDFEEFKDIAGEIIDEDKDISDKLRALLPSFRYVKHVKKENENDDSSIVQSEEIDVDTEEEIRFGEAMKNNRLEYLAKCSITGESISASTQGASIAPSPYGMKSPSSDSVQRGGKKARKQGRVKTEKLEKMDDDLEVTPPSYDQNDDPDYSEANAGASGRSKKHKLSSHPAKFTSVIVGPNTSVVPSESDTANSNDNAYPVEFEASERRKRVKRGSMSSNSQTMKVIPLTSKSLELHLNNDLKHSNSKIAVTKKGKNKVLSQFLKEFLMLKTEKYRLKRLSFGHVDYFFKNGNLRLGKDLMLLQHFEYADYNKYNKNYVPNIFSRRSDSKSAINNTNNSNKSSLNEVGVVKNENEEKDNNLLTKADLPHLNSKFEDYGEFKINVYKSYSKLNNLLFKVLEEARSQSEKTTTSSSSEDADGSEEVIPTISSFSESHSSFLDDIFDRVE